MEKKGNWAQPVWGRERRLRSLDSMIGRNDPVRLFYEILEEVDWSPWEAEYAQNGLGQPAIHPKIIAAAILFGLLRGIRSTRRLEDACRYRLDFMWLVENRRIDHTTFSKFRTKFREALKDLFRQLGRIAMGMGAITLGVATFDGTRVKANNARFKTRTAKTLEEQLQALDELFEALMAKMEAGDAEEEDQGSPTQLPSELADVERRRELLHQALEKAKAADAARRKDGINPQKNPAQVCMTDVDAHVMPNKEGGYAPNYTPTCTVDAQEGFILDCDVTADVNEGPLLVPSVDRIEENFGQKPKQLVTDAGNNSGQIQQALEERGVEFYAPVESNTPQEGHPAKREDPTQPVPSSEASDMPRNNQRTLDKSCFIYDEEKDLYYCPQGHAMPFEKTKPGKRGGQTITLRVYRCGSCQGCPLVEACITSSNKKGRTITRDPFEEVRERTAARMTTESARELCRQRPRIAETPFGILKSVMGLRQFLLRGLEKVKTEWRWAATAFNIAKLIRITLRLRAESAKLALAE